MVAIFSVTYTVIVSIIYLNHRFPSPLQETYSSIFFCNIGQSKIVVLKHSIFTFPSWEVGITINTEWDKL